MQAISLPTRNRLFAGLTAWAALWLSCLFIFQTAYAQARTTGGIDAYHITLNRSEETLNLDFNLKVQLPAAAEDALKRGVPLYFIALAEVYRTRWYWFDLRIGQAQRTWRLTYQPLTGLFRVNYGGLTQSFNQLKYALATITQATQWQILEISQLPASEKHYVEFSWKLDTSQLPSPLQLGIANGASEWSMGIEHTLPLN